MFISPNYAIIGFNSRMNLGDHDSLIWNKVTIILPDECFHRNLIPGLWDVWRKELRSSSSENLWDQMADSARFGFSPVDHPQ